MGSKTAKDAHPNWRPDFCNQATLPDIKVVRTNFLINFLSVTAALVAVYFMVEREYRAHSLTQTVAVLEQQVASARKTNNANLSLSTEFKKISSKVVDLQQFFSTPFEAHSFMARIVELCPAGLVIQDLSYSEVFPDTGKAKKVSEYLINISGEVDDPLILGEFKTSLESSGIFEVGDLGAIIDESLQRRVVDTGIFPYRITIKLAKKEKSAENKKGKAK
ncbi:MAG: hypothetical protein ACSHYA_15710 [Opitutaceae bacterium]